MPKLKPKDEIVSTSIGVSVKTKRELGKIMTKHESYNDVILRLILGQINVYAEVVLVDNELPVTHDVVMQVGEDTDSIFLFEKGQKPRPISLQEVQARIKMSKPNMTITREEAKIVKKWLESLESSTEEYAKLWHRINTFILLGAAEK